MPPTPRTIRIAAALAGVGAVALALGIRAVTGGWVEQLSGTALYGSLIYALVMFARPRTRPVAAAALATGLCWAVELSQLTGVPAALSAKSMAARLVLGLRFDPLDLIWYPLGALLFMVLHRVLLRSRR